MPPIKAKAQSATCPDNSKRHKKAIPLTKYTIPNICLLSNLSEKYPAQNTGSDEVLEISNINGINQLSSAQGDLPAVNRALIQFKNANITNIDNHLQW